MLGAAALLVVLGSLATAAVAVRRRVLPDWTGAPARLAEIVTGLALLIGILEVLGAVGLFELGPIVIACALAGVAGVRSLAGTQVPRHRHTWNSDRSAWLLGALALLAGATVIAEWGALTIQSYDVGIRGFDSLWYHLPWAASFAQTGNIVSLRFTDVEYLTPFYPATAEMLHGLGIVLLGRDTLSPGLNLVWLALTLLAAYCIGRPRGVGAATTIGAALAMTTMMMDYSQAGAAANDVVAVFFLLAAVALLMTDAERPAVLVLAAVAAGLAVGTKLTVLAPALALTVGVVAIAPRGETTQHSGRMARAAGPRRRLLVRAQPDCGRQPAAVDECRRDPAHAGAAAPAAHRVQRRALPDELALLEPLRTAGPGVRARPVVVGRAGGGDPRSDPVPAARAFGKKVRLFATFFPSDRPDARTNRAVLARGVPDHARDRSRTERRPPRVRVQPALPRARARAGAGGGAARAGAVVGPGDQNHSGGRAGRPSSRDRRPTGAVAELPRGGRGRDRGGRAPRGGAGGHSGVARASDPRSPAPRSRS